MMNFRKSLLVTIVTLAMFLMSVSFVHATTVTIKNLTGASATLTDFISFANNNNTGAKTEHLKKKNAADDVTLAKFGKKNFEVGNHKSWTVSWNNSAGVEVETDTTKTPFGIYKSSLAMFDSNFWGLYDIEYDFSIASGIPNVGDVFTIDPFGHLTGAGLDWITFFDVTSSGSGFIERDALGNAISPLLPAGTVVTTSFLWEIEVVPEPGTGILFAIGFIGLAFAQRKSAITNLV